MVTIKLPGEGLAHDQQWALSDVDFLFWFLFFVVFFAIGVVFMSEIIVSVWLFTLNILV